MLVNGKLLPYLDVEPRKYRFRILNGSMGASIICRLSERSQMRFTDRHRSGIACRRRSRSSMFMLAPGERADLVVDFSAHARRAASCSRVKPSRSCSFAWRERPAPDASRCPRALRPVLDASRSRLRSKPGGSPSTRVEYRGRVHGMLLNKTPWHMPVTEKPVLDTHRDLGTRQPHRRLASDPSASGALPDSRPPALRCLRIT